MTHDQMPKKVFNKIGYYLRRDGQIECVDKITETDIEAYSGETWMLNGRKSSFLETNKDLVKYKGKTIRWPQMV